MSNVDGGQISSSTPEAQAVPAADVAALADLLHETADHHDPYEKMAPKHDWWDWYAAYMVARQHGSTPDDASAAAGRYMQEARGIVVR
jgi:hypothetical protein